jgi:hypothetical protein
MFDLNFDHFAFLASLYFCFGSLCSPPGRQFLSRRASTPWDFLYSAFGIHRRFPVDAGLAPVWPDFGVQSSLPEARGRDGLRSPKDDCGRSDLKPPVRGRESGRRSRVKDPLGFHSGRSDRFGAGVNSPFGFQSSFSDRDSGRAGRSRSKERDGFRGGLSDRSARSGLSDRFGAGVNAPFGFQSSLPS